MTDEDCMRMAINQANLAVRRGEQPFGAVITLGGYLVSAAGQGVTKYGPTGHAEILAMNAAYSLDQATLYSTVEACAMCSFIARENKIKRVVYGLKSPIMGGCSHWPILQDTALNKSELGFLNVAFAAPPEILGGVLKDDVWASWYSWNAVAAEAMRVGGILV